jgi:hypothetical protein
VSRCRRNRRKEYVLTWGDLYCYELAEERSAEAIVVRGYEPLIEIVEASRTDEGLNIK